MPLLESTKRRHVAAVCLFLVGLSLVGLSFVGLSRYASMPSAKACEGASLQQIRDEYKDQPEITIAQVTDKEAKAFIAKFGTSPNAPDNFRLFLMTDGKMSMILVIVDGCMVDRTSVVPLSDMLKNLGHGSPA